MSQGPVRDIHFDLIEETRGKSGQGGRKFFRQKGPQIKFSWLEGAPRTFRIHYLGSEGIMIFPLENFFQGLPGKRGLVFELDGKNPLELTLRDRADIERDHGGSLVLDGNVEVQLSIFSKKFLTYAEENSPPPIQLGP